MKVGAVELLASPAIVFITAYADPGIHRLLPLRHPRWLSGSGVTAYRR
jgi:hypothetical protein